MHNISLLGYLRTANMLCKNFVSVQQRPYSLELVIIHMVCICEVLCIRGTEGVHCENVSIVRYNI